MSEAGRPCSICTHPERHAIERRIVEGATLGAISAEYGMSANSVQRHRDNHLGPVALALAEQQRAEERAEQGEDLARMARSLRNKAIGLLSKAEKAGDLRTALAGVREAGRLLEIEGKLAGQIGTSTTVNVVFTQQFVAVQTVLLNALAPFPEARQAVVEALAAAESGP